MSKRYVPCIEEEDEKILFNEGRFTFLAPIPDNFIRVVKCENENKQTLSYTIDKQFIKVINNECGPFNLYYEATKSNILENLINIIGGNKKKK